MALDCRDTINELFCDALSNGARNEWMVFLIAAYDRRTRFFFPYEKVPPGLGVRLTSSRIGQILVAAMPIRLRADPRLVGHPFVQQFHKIDRVKLGTDIAALAYAYGQTFLGSLLHDLDVQVVSRSVPAYRQELIEDLYPRLVPQLRAALVEDSKRFGLPPGQIAYQVLAVRNPDSKRNITETEWENGSTSDLCTAVDTFPLEKFCRDLSEQYKQHPDVVKFITAPVEPGCFRTLIALFGNVMIADFPIIPLARQEPSGGPLS